MAANFVYQVSMDEPCNRLFKARTTAGFRSGRAAAAAIGVKPATYASHENGTRTIRVLEARRYAQFFHVSPGWILTGEDLQGGQFADNRNMFQADHLPGDAASSLQSSGKANLDIFHFGKKVLDLLVQMAPSTDFAPNNNSTTVAEVVIPSMSIEDYDLAAEQWKIISQWQFPIGFIVDELKISLDDDTAMIAVIDDNMSPTYNVGDRLIVNFSQKKFIDDGVYIFLDEIDKIHIQRLQRESSRSSGFDRTRLIISNDNPAENSKHKTGLFDEHGIQPLGFVCGKIATSVS